MEEMSVTEPVEETSHRSSIDFRGNGEESSFEFWPVQMEETSVTEPVEETSHRSSIDFRGNGEESSFEFWPVQHPSEPPEEDRPVECPMPADSSVINGNTKLQEKFSERLQRNSAVFNNREKRLDRVLPLRATRKRHHGEPMTKPLLGRHSLDQFLPPRNLTMFQMLNKFDS